MIKDQQTSRGRPICSAVLDDGTIVEMIHHPAEEVTSLLVCRGDQCKETDAANLPGLGSVVPFSHRNNLIAHRVILFPSGKDEYVSQEQLVSEIRAFIHRYADLSPAFEEIAGLYVLMTWIYDAFREVPYLRFKGDFGSGKSRCLQTVGSLCYKPMFASGASTVSPLFRMIDTFRGTLVIDEGDFRFSDEHAEVIKILNNGNAEGFPVLRSEATPSKEFNPRAFKIFGPKIIATRAHFEDRALESRCITEVMTGLPPRPDIALSLPAAFESEATALRNRLLAFRITLRNIERAPVDTSGLGLEPRVAQVFAPLLAVAPDVQARERILVYATRASRAIRIDRGASNEAQLLDIMWELQQDGEPLGVKRITEKFAERFGMDYRRPITPKWIGVQIRTKLALATVKSHGSFVVPTSEYDRLSLLHRQYESGSSGGGVDEEQ